MAKLVGMHGIHLSHVTRTNRATNYPRLIFTADWLDEMGFVSGALVQYLPDLPEKHGLTFVLCNDNIHKYSELSHATKEKGGTLIQVYQHRDTLQLCISGTALDSVGLKYGDALIARYEYGLIRIRKLPGSAVTLVTSHVLGTWLTELGFTRDAVLTIAAEPGLITCTLQENDLESIKTRTTELVKYARQNKLNLIQVQKTKYKKRISRGESVYHFFDIPQSCLEKAGFSPNEMLLAFYEPGLIKLQKPDFVALGF